MNPNHLTETIAKNALVTLLYAGMGYFGLLLAVPPGYATPIWPPSGIALGAAIVWGLRILPGVLLGSFLINMYAAFQTNPVILSPLPISIAFLIACGAVAQTFFGWYLVKKFIGLKNVLDYPRDILLFAILSGPIASLINATWSNIMLLMLNVVTYHTFFTSWRTWYIGDSIGALIFAPSFLILFAQPATIWRKKILTILLPLVISFVVVLLGYRIVSQIELDRINSMFNQKIQDQIEKINNNILMSDSLTRALANYIALTPQINDAIFVSSSQEFLRDFKFIAAFIWLENKNLTFYPKYFNFALQANKNEILNTFSKVNWQTFLSSSASNAKFIVSGPIKLTNDVAILILEPVVKDGNLLGYSTAVINFNSLIEKIFQNKKDYALFSIADISLKEKNSLYSYRSNEDNSASKNSISLEKNLHLNGRTWEIKGIASQSFMNKQYSWQVWTILIVGLFFCAMINIVLFLLYGRHHIIQIRMEYYDNLTGLPNVLNFTDQLAKAIKKAKNKQTKFALCLIELEDFKTINENYGQIIADEFLKVIPGLMQPCLKHNDFLARLRGGQFAALLEDIQSINDVIFIVEHLQQAIQQKIKIDNIEVQTSSSIGIAVYPTAGTTPEELMKNAENTLFRTKKMGRNLYNFFDVNTNEFVKRHLEINKALPTAIDKKQLNLSYQIQVDSHSEKVMGIEALIRWCHEELGEISPQEFIPLAEDNGSIHSIGEWILLTACADYAKLSALLGKNTPDLSINVSVKQLENKNFIFYLQSILKKYPQVKNHLILEVTETALMKNLEEIRLLTNQIKELGIRFGLDDFGTGYSSLHYLRHLSVSQIKIDKSFLKDIFINENDATITKMTVQLAHSLGIQTVAEGVETKEQLAFLREIGCDKIQGYYFGMPLTYAELIKRLKKAH